MWMTIATALTALIAVLHGYFMWLEMCGWTRPAGRRAFGLTIEFAEQTRRLAANQGCTTGFGSRAGVVAVAGQPGGITVVFLACVLVAGVYGVTASAARFSGFRGASALALVALAWREPEGHQARFIALQHPATGGP